MSCTECAISEKDHLAAGKQPTFRKLLVSERLQPKQGAVELHCLLAVRHLEHLWGKGAVIL